MNASELFQSLHAGGFALAAEGPELVLRGPVETLTQAQRDAIRQGKPELLDLVANHHIVSTQAVAPHAGPWPLTKLAGELESRGYTLAGDAGDIALHGPMPTPELVAALRHRRQELLGLLANAGPGLHNGFELLALRPVEAWHFPSSHEGAGDAKNATTSVAACKCGSTETVEVTLALEPHNGQSSRIDCKQCGRFIRFWRWYGQVPTGAYNEAAPSTSRNADGA